MTENNDDENSWLSNHFSMSKIDMLKNVKKSSFKAGQEYERARILKAIREEINAQGKEKEESSNEEEKRFIFAYMSGLNAASLIVKWVEVNDETD